MLTDAVRTLPGTVQRVSFIPARMRRYTHGFELLEEPVAPVDVRGLEALCELCANGKMIGQQQL